MSSLPLLSTVIQLLIDLMHGIYTVTLTSTYRRQLCLLPAPYSAPVGAIRNDTCKNA